MRKIQIRNSNFEIGNKLNEPSPNIFEFLTSNFPARLGSGFAGLGYATCVAPQRVGFLHEGEVTLTIAFVATRMTRVETRRRQTWSVGVPHPFPPQVDGGPADLQTRGNRLVLFFSECSQDDPATQRHLLGSAWGRLPLFQSRSLHQAAGAVASPTYFGRRPTPQISQAASATSRISHQR
jgi:hypothetical protein